MVAKDEADVQLLRSMGAGPEERNDCVVKIRFDLGVCQSVSELNEWMNV